MSDYAPDRGDLYTENKKYWDDFKEQDVEKKLQNLEVGDIVEYDRERVPHHDAIYIGDGKIIEMDGDDGKKNMKVRVNDFKKAVERAPFSYVYKGNNKDKEWRPFPPEEIKRRAESKLGQGDYDLRSNNCQHFANWCRYGKHESQMAEEHSIGISVVETAVGAFEWLKSWF